MIVRSAAYPHALTCARTRANMAPRKRYRSKRGSMSNRVENHGLAVSHHLQRLMICARLLCLFTMPLVTCRANMSYKEALDLSGGSRRRMKCRRMVKRYSCVSMLYDCSYCRLASTFIEASIPGCELVDGEVLRHWRDREEDIEVPLIKLSSISQDAHV